MPNHKQDYVLGQLARGTNISPFNDIYSLVVNISENGLTYDDDKTTRLVDALVIWGGVDIHPSIYNAPMHHSSQQRDRAIPHNRDYYEWWAIHEAVVNKIPIIGVCRGAQMLCCYAGGTLYQDVTNHNRSHSILTYKDEVFTPQASHHQMMNLEGTKHELLAWNHSTKSSHYIIDNLNKKHFIDKEPEVVWFPEIKGLAIQAHPEWDGAGSKFNDWILSEIMERFL